MTDSEHTFLMLYSAMIASDCNANRTYEQMYNYAEDAAAYYYKRKKIDKLLPEGIDLPKFKEALNSFMDDYYKAQNYLRPVSNPFNASTTCPQGQVTGVYDKQKVAQFHELFRHFKISLAGPDGVQGAIRIFLDEYALNPDNCREVYDYMHEMKFINI